MRCTAINGVNAVISFPSYTQAPPETIGTLAGRIYAMAGSRIEIGGETSKPVAEGSMDFARGKSIPLTPVPGGFEGSFLVTEDDTFTLRIADTSGLRNERAIRYPVVALDDMTPSIEIISPQDGDHLPLSLEVELEYEAADDFGLSSVTLHYLREGKDSGYMTRKLPLPGGGPPRDIETSYSWALTDLSLFPGDVLLYYLEAEDNNAVTGPGAGRTEQRRLVLPSLGEIYERISERETARRDGLDRIQEESRIVRRDLEKLMAEYKARGTFDWSRQREAEELIERHEELMDRTREAGDQLGETLAELERNRATSQEIGEKLAEIRDLLDRIESEQLREAVERFRARLGEVAPDELLAAMKDLDMNMEELARRLERTAELLRRIMREERLEELIRRVESMLAEQRDIRDSEEEGGDLADRQEELAAGMDDLDKDLGSFEEDTGGPMEGWEEMLEGLDLNELAAMMNDAARDLMMDDRGSAMRSQNEALDGMLALYTSLARFQLGMGVRMDDETARRISGAARQLVEISKQQEEAGVGYPGAGGAAERAGRQLLIREAIRAVRDQLYVTARKTMAISYDVFMHIGRALEEAERIIEDLERGNAGAAARAGRACESLNLAAVELLRTSSALGSGAGEGTGGKMQSLMQGQSSIDAALREMMGSGDGSWSMAERARMARLAAEQRKLEELLEEIGRETVDTGSLLGRLDDLGGEMMEVVRRLEEARSTKG